MADKELEKIIQHVQDGITETFQVDMFGSEPKCDVLIDACKRFLKYRGFKIVDPLNKEFNVKKADDLITLFYSFLYYYHPELTNVYRNMSVNRKLANLFIKTRMTASGVNKKEAMNECASIIKTIFEHEEEFKFDRPITFDILGQKNCGWITDKAIQLINKNKLNGDEERRDKLIASYENVYDSEPGGFEDLSEILEKL